MLEEDHKYQKRDELCGSLQQRAERVVCLLLFQRSEQGVSPGIVHRSHGEDGRRPRLEEVRDDNANNFLDIVKVAERT